VSEEKWERLRRMQEELKKNSKVIITQQAQIAHVNRAYYENLMSQGFTEEQALRLVEVQVEAMYTPPDGGESR